MDSDEYDDEWVQFLEEIWSVNFPGSNLSLIKNALVV